jgi:hypothetical protein
MVDIFMKRKSGHKKDIPGQGMTTKRTDYLKTQ